MKKILLLITLCLSIPLAAMLPTSLHYATQYGDLQDVKTIIEKAKLQNANLRELLNQKDHVLNRTPLHHAARYGRIDIVKYLIEQDHHIDALGEENKTPLHLAVRYDHIDTVRYLVELCADIDTRDENRYTPVLRALDQGHIAISNYLTRVKYYLDTRTVTTSTDQNELEIPDYCLLAVIKNNPCDINHFIEQFDYVINPRYYITYMQLPEDKDGGLQELIWHDLNHKKVCVTPTKPLEAFIIKNKIGFKVLTQYNLYKKITNPDTHFDWK